jgi:hypothetical protein
MLPGITKNDKKKMVENGIDEEIIDLLPMLQVRHYR